MLLPDMLDTLVAESASAVVKDLGSSLWRKVTSRRGNRRVRKLLSKVPDPSEARDFIGKLNPAQAAGIEHYLASKDFTVAATRVAVMLYQDENEAPTSITKDLVAQQVVDGLYLSTRLKIEELQPFANLIVDHLTAKLYNILSADPLPDNAVTAIIATSADHAAASVRNSEILRKLDRLDDIHHFITEFRAQVRSLHSKMRLPNINVAAPQPYEKLYIAPDLKLRGTPDTPVTSADLLNVGTRGVVLGDPGAGKSTLASKITYDLALDNNTNSVVPFLVILRDYTETFQAQRTSFIEHLLDLCKGRYQIRTSLDTLEYLLLNGHATVIFDGLDELVETALRRKVVDSIEAFTHLYPDTTILVTSRIIGYDEAPLDPALFPVAVIQPLSEQQVERYAQKWFELENEMLQGSRKTKARSFLAESSEVHDLRVNPLMLSLMCQMYAEEGYIPANRPQVYEKCATMLFERWDRVRGIAGIRPFDAHVRGAVQSLAWWVYREPQYQKGVKRHEIIKYLTNYWRRERFADEADAENAAVSFVEFCTGRAWILIDIGANKHEELYDFAHRTFLEYFAAKQIARENPNAHTLFDLLEQRLRRAEWDVFCQLSLQILDQNIENGGNDFLGALIDAVVASNAADGSNLLSFAIRSLRFIVPNPSTLRRLVESIVNFAVDVPDSQGRVRDRMQVRPTELNKYDQHLTDLFLCGKEMSRDVLIQLESVFDEKLKGVSFARYLPLFDVIHFFFPSGMIRPSWQQLWDELSGELRIEVSDRACCFRDVALVRAGQGLDGHDFLTRHGVAGLYEVGLIAPAIGKYHFSGSILDFLNTGSSINPIQENLAAQLASLLPRQVGPWTTEALLLQSIESNKGVVRGLWAGSCPDLFVTLTLLWLPYAEREFQSVSLNEPSVGRRDLSVGVERIVGACKTIRTGGSGLGYVAQSLRDMGFSTTSALFIERWMRNEISLMQP